MKHDTILMFTVCNIMHITSGPSMYHLAIDVSCLNDTISQIYVHFIGGFMPFVQRPGLMPICLGSCVVMLGDKTCTVIMVEIVCSFQHIFCL